MRHRLCFCSFKRTFRRRISRCLNIMLWMMEWLKMSFKNFWVMLQDFTTIWGLTTLSDLWNSFLRFRHLNFCRFWIPTQLVSRSLRRGTSTSIWLTRSTHKSRLSCIRLKSPTNNLGSQSTGAWPPSSHKTWTTKTSKLWKNSWLSKNWSSWTQGPSNLKMERSSPSQLDRLKKGKKNWSSKISNS